MVRGKQNNHLLTTSEVAQLLNVHINTVRHWSNKGLLKVFRIGPRGDRRFQKQDIINFLNESKASSGSAPNQ